MVPALKPSVLLLLLLITGVARAQSGPPPNYSLPFQLRPVAVSNTLRLDTSFATWNDASRTGSTLVTGFIGSWKVAEKTALLGRVSFIDNHPKAGGSERSARVVSNPLFGFTRATTQAGGGRLAFFGAATIPIGGGGGDSASAAQTSALSRAIATRSAMDNALFAVNYATLIGGASVATVKPRGTLQAEATLLQLFRVRGPSVQDGTRTNFTAGIHAGLAVGRRLTIGSELRYQRWLSDAAPARTSPRARETLTFAIGPRFHLKAGKRAVRPGFSFSLPLDHPLSGQKYRIWQVDIPVSI